MTDFFKPRAVTGRVGAAHTNETESDANLERQKPDKGDESHIESKAYRNRLDGKPADRPNPVLSGTNRTTPFGYTERPTGRQSFDTSNPGQDHTVIDSQPGEWREENKAAFDCEDAHDGFEKHSAHDQDSASNSHPEGIGGPLTAVEAHRYVHGSRSAEAHYEGKL